MITDLISNDAWKYSVEPWASEYNLSGFFCITCVNSRYVSGIPRVFIQKKNTEVFSLSISNNPELVEGIVFLTRKQLSNCKKWIILNESSLLWWWNSDGKTESCFDFIGQLNRI
jgi:hypothetical protein